MLSGIKIRWPKPVFTQLLIVRDRGVGRIKHAIFHDERQVSIGRHARHHSLLIVGTMPKLWLKPGFRRRALTHSAPP